MSLRAALSKVGLNDVSRETLERLDIYGSLLRRWNKKINLVAPKTLDELEERHIADSAQFYLLAPTGRTWTDLGTGAGLPGLVVAALKASDPDFKMTLIDSDSRKSVFQREAAREMGLTMDIRTSRIEENDPTQTDIVSARALAPLPKLLSLAAPHMKKNGQALFAKGEKAAEELTEASRDWIVRSNVIPSRTRAGAAIFHIQGRPHARTHRTE